MNRKLEKQVYKGHIQVLACLINNSLVFWQTQKMELERERLNQRIFALTEKLADAKFTDSVESFNVRSFNI